MPKRIVPLSDAQLKRAKSAAKQYTLFDGGGLFLIVTPTGGKLWRLKYRYQGQAKVLALGLYPELSLADARHRRQEAREQITKGIDPAEVKRALKEAQGVEKESFEAIAREWHNKFASIWAISHAATIIRRLELDAFPVLGRRPLGEITPPVLLAMLRRIESRGALETAHRVRTICGQIFRYAIATGRAERDPAADLRGALPPYKQGHHPAVTDPKQLGALLRDIDGYEGSFVVKCALRLAPLVFVRPGELRHAEWSEIDLVTSRWDIPAVRMKGNLAHVVPLSRQAVTVLRELHTLTGGGKYLFPCNRSTKRAMSDNTLNAALRRLGYDKDTVTCHGFRATARTLLDEILHFRLDLIEHQLAHAVRDPLGRAYNRTQFLNERGEMMQIWADYLDTLRNSHN